MVMRFDRRSFLAASASLSLGAVVPRPLLAQEALLRKKIPSSGEEIPIIGLGTALRCDNPRTLADSEATMRRERLDFIQVHYALDNRGAGERILPLAAGSSRRCRQSRCRTGPLTSRCARGRSSSRGDAATHGRIH